MNVFSLFAPRRHYVTARTFLDVPDRSPIPDRLRERSMNVFDRFAVIFDRLGSFEERSKKLDGQERWMVKNVRRPGTFMLHTMNELERLQNHIQVLASKTKVSL